MESKYSQIFLIIWSVLTNIQVFSVLIHLNSLFAGAGQLLLLPQAKRSSKWTSLLEILLLNSWAGDCNGGADRLLTCGGKIHYLHEVGLRLRCNHRNSTKIHKYWCTWSLYWLARLVPGLKEMTHHFTSRQQRGIFFNSRLEFLSIELYILERFS